MTFDADCQLIFKKNTISIQLAHKIRIDLVLIFHSLDLLQILSYIYIHVYISCACYTVTL